MTILLEEDVYLAWFLRRCSRRAAFSPGVDDGSSGTVVPTSLGVVDDASSGELDVLTGMRLKRASSWVRLAEGG